MNPPETPLIPYERRKDFACDVCGNVPDESGTIEHGRGCYVVSADGGGESHCYEMEGVIIDAQRQRIKYLEAENARLVEEIENRNAEYGSWLADIEAKDAALHELAEVKRSLKREQAERLRAERERDEARGLLHEWWNEANHPGIEFSGGSITAKIKRFVESHPMTAPQPDPREVLRGKIKRTEHAADYIVMALNGRLVTAMNISTNGEQWFAFYPHRENGGDEFDTMAEAVTAGENDLIDRALATEGQEKGATRLSGDAG